MQSILLIAFALAFVKFAVWYDKQEKKYEEYLELRRELNRMKELDQFRYEYYKYK